MGNEDATARLIRIVFRWRMGVIIRERECRLGARVDEAIEREGLRDRWID